MSVRRLALYRGVLSVAALVVAGAGCQAPLQPSGPTEIVVHVAEIDAFVDHAMTSLRERDFAIQRADRTHGAIVTHPSTSAQWFELWRGDAPGPYQWLESSLHTIRRTVSVTLTPADGADGTASAADAPPVAQDTDSTSPASGDATAYRLEVRVDKERLSSPQRQITTASGALAIYSERVPTREGLRRAEVAGEHWVPLGRDGLLEAELLAVLVERTGVEIAE